MKITKRQLRRLIKEACGLDVTPVSIDTHAPSVPVPEDYDATRNFLQQNQDLVDLGINMVMQAAGTHCERSTAQAIIDHLQEMLEPVQQEPPSVGPALGFTGPGF